MILSLVTVALSTGLTLIQGAAAPLTIIGPANVTTCDDVQFIVQGGTPPYALTIYPGTGTLEGAPLVEIASTTSNEIYWTPDFGGVQPVTAAVQDSAGLVAEFDLTVASNPDPNCPLSVTTTSTTFLAPQTSSTPASVTSQSSTPQVVAASSPSTTSAAADGNVQTTPAAPTSTQISASQTSPATAKSSTSSTAAIAVAAAVAVVVILIVAIAVVVFVIRRSKRSEGGFYRENPKDLAMSPASKDGYNWRAPALHESGLPNGSETTLSTQATAPAAPFAGRATRAISTRDFDAPEAFPQHPRRP